MYKKVLWNRPLTSQYLDKGKGSHSFDNGHEEQIAQRGGRKPCPDQSLLLAAQPILLTRCKIQQNKTFLS